MRKLTFEGFLKQYVAELSGVQTASVHKLAACLNENPRLKEPLFLYALTFDKVELLLRYTANSAVAAEYEQLSNRYSLAQMRLLLAIIRTAGRLFEGLAQLLFGAGCRPCRQ